MSIFGQVWLWSLAAFVLGALLTWVLLVRPVQARVRELERKLTSTRSEPVEETEGHGAQAERRGLPLEREADFFGDAEYRPDPDEWELPYPAYQDVEDDFDAFEPSEGEMSEESFDPPYEYVTDPAGPVGRRDEHTELFEPARPEDVDSGAVPDERTRVDLVGSVGAALDPAPPPDGVGATEMGYAEPTDARGLFQSALPTTTGPHYESRFEQGWARDTPEDEAALAEPVGEAPTELTEAVDSVDALPKRRPRGESPPGGFELPEPVQPSMRTVLRRQPTQDDRDDRDDRDDAAYGGSLFEPSVPPESMGTEPDAAPFAPGAGEQAESEDESEDAGVAAGPFGPGSAMPLPGGAKPGEEFEIKASVTTLRYCSPASPRFDDMVAEVWFRGAADAERVGFRSID